MSKQAVVIPEELLELLDEDALDLQQLAQYCCVSTEWISTHVQAGVLEPSSGADSSQWRFAGTTLRRVRRIVEFERIYDADPQLAALTADLLEEVARLRRLLGQY